MYTNCDEVFKVTIPAVRATVAKALSKRGMSQSEIAVQLGTTQAAVNKYLNGKYSIRITKIEKAIEAKGLAKRIVADAVSGKGKKEVSHGIDRLASSGPIVKEAMKLMA